jgi:hypothetical protein
MTWYRVVAVVSLLLATVWLVDTWQIDMDSGTEVAAHIYSGSITIFNASSVTVTLRSPLPFQLAIKPGRTLIKSSQVSRSAGNQTHTAQYHLSESSNQGVELQIQRGGDVSVTLVSTEPLRVEVRRWSSADRETRQSLALTVMGMLLYSLSWLDRHEWLYRLRDKMVYKT